MCGPAIPIIMAAAAVASAGASIYSGIKSNQNQQTAMSQAQKQAATTQAANERAINQANQKSPNLALLATNNRGINSGGVASTMLTGPTGAMPGNTMLGSSTLLGR